MKFSLGVVTFSAVTVGGGVSNGRDDVAVSIGGITSPARVKGGASFYELWIISTIDNSLKSSSRVHELFTLVRRSQHIT